MKNKQIDLVNHLFAQMERLGDESLSKEQVRNEIDRSKGIASVASQINQTLKLSIEAQKLKNEMPVGNALPEILQ